MPIVSKVHDFPNAPTRVILFKQARARRPFVRAAAKLILRPFHAPALWIIIMYDVEPVVRLAVYILRLNHNSSVFLVVCCSLAAPRPSFRLFRLSRNIRHIRLRAQPVPSYFSVASTSSLMSFCMHSLSVRLRLVQLITAASSPSIILLMLSTLHICSSVSKNFGLCVGQKLVPIL